MDAYREPPRGGAEMDYATWAISVPGVTRAWCLRNGYGAGTVVVYIMLDAAQAGHDGFPVGQDGVATDEPRGVPAVGDQLTVANALYPLQPVTALVYVCSPRRNSLTLTLEGLSGASLSTRAAIAQVVAGVLMLSGSPNRAVVNRTDLVTAIRAVPQTAGFVLGSSLAARVAWILNIPETSPAIRDTCPFWRTSFTDHRRGSNGCFYSAQDFARALLALLPSGRYGPRTWSPHRDYSCWPWRRFMCGRRHGRAIWSLTPFRRQRWNYFPNGENTLGLPDSAPAHRLRLGSASHRLWPD